MEFVYSGKLKLYHVLHFALITKIHRNQSSWLAAKIILQLRLRKSLRLSLSCPLDDSFAREGGVVVWERTATSRVVRLGMFRLEGSGFRVITATLNRLGRHRPIIKGKLASWYAAVCCSKLSGVF